MSRCVAGWVDRTGMGHTVVGRLLLGRTVRGKGWVGSTGHYQDSVCGRVSRLIGSDPTQDLKPLSVAYRPGGGSTTGTADRIRPSWANSSTGVPPPDRCVPPTTTSSLPAGYVRWESSVVARLLTASYGCCQPRSAAVRQLFVDSRNQVSNIPLPLTSIWPRDSNT